MAEPIDDLGVQARLRPGALAIADLTSERQWTYAEFDGAVARCAGALAARTIGEGDRVAALSKNRAELVMLHLACARLGAIYVPLNWRLAGAEVQWLLENAEPKLLLLDKSLDNATFDGVDINLFATEIETARPFAGAAFDHEKPSLILYTSGTSGHPKGALLSERNLAETAINFGILGAVNERSVFLCDSPMFHIIGLITNVRPALMRGGSVLISDGFVPDRTIARIADASLKVTHYFGVPQMASVLRADPAFHPDKFRGLTALFTGGAPHPAANIRAWLADGIPVVDGFGMSEAGTVFGMSLDLDIIDRYAGSVGVGTSRIEARIIDAEGADVKTGEPGELLLRGPTVTAGYWRREKESKDAFTPDGWFKTGDIARQNEDGFYWLVDRRKDMFISGGENVYPAELEAVVAAITGVKESAVIGVPDERWGEVGHLFWAAHDGVEIEEAAIKAALTENLARYKIPKHYSRIDALPRNGAGKVLKPVLRQMIAERKS